MPSSKPHEFGITDREAKRLARVGEHVLTVAQLKDQFQIPLVDRLRTFALPTLAVQGAIDDAAASQGIELQTYRAYVYNGDRATPYTALIARVVTRGSLPVLPPLAEHALLPNHAGYAIDVYPPIG